jgi:hypothetical protein
VHSDVSAGFAELAAFIIAAGTFPAAVLARCFVEPRLPMLERTSRVNKRVGVGAHGALGLGCARRCMLLRHLAASRAAASTPRPLLRILSCAFRVPVRVVVVIK